MVRNHSTRVLELVRIHICWIDFTTLFSTTPESTANEREALHVISTAWRYVKRIEKLRLVLDNFDVECALDFGKMHNLHGLSIRFARDLLRSGFDAWRDGLYALVEVIPTTVERISLRNTRPYRAYATNTPEECRRCIRNLFPRQLDDVPTCGVVFITTACALSARTKPTLACTSVHCEHECGLLQVTPFTFTPYSHCIFVLRGIQN